MSSDGAEGLVDAQARIQERMDELEAARHQGRGPLVKDAARLERAESYRLARVALEGQMAVTAHPARRSQIEQAIAEIDRRIAQEK